MEPLWRVLNTLERELGNKQSYATECVPEGRTLSQHHRDTCGPTFTTARKWNLATHHGILLSCEENRNHNTEARWMELETIMLSKIRQVQTDT